MTDINIRKLYIKKRPAAEWLTLFILVMPFLMPTLIDFIGLPSILKYLIDFAWIVVTVFLFVNRKISLKKRVFPFVVFVGLFLLYAAVSYLFNYESVFYFLWGFRNNFRFYFAFFAFAMVLHEEDGEMCLKFMDFLFWVNAAVAFFQFFFLGLRQDFLGGIFGADTGCNAYLLIFFCIVVVKSVLSFMNGTENTIVCLLKCGISLVISAMAELKFFFILFCIILVISAICTKFSWRKLVLFFLCAILFMFASSLLTGIFGADNNLSFERILDLSFATQYSSTEDLGRITAIPSISNRFFDSTADNLFGRGLGNCDTSSFEICNTPFFKQYSGLHYNWFLSAFLFIETGAVGLIMHIIFYIICLVVVIKMLRRKTANQLFCQMSIIMSAMCMIIVFYNCSLRMEVGYLAFFAIALPFMSAKELPEKAET